MEAVGAAPAIGSLVITTLRLAKELVQACQTLSKANIEVHERIAVVQNHGVRIVEQLDFLQSIWTDLSEDLQQNQEANLDILMVKLQSSIKKIGGLLKRQTMIEAARSRETGPTVKRWKYFLVKPYLDETLADLDKWQSRYDPTWFLILRIAKPAIDSELQRKTATSAANQNTILTTAIKVRGAVKDSLTEPPRIFLPKGSLLDAHVEDVKHSAAKYVRRAGSARWIIIDSVRCGPGSHPDLIRSDIRKLATKLHYVDAATFSVLACFGVVETFVDNNRSNRLLSFEMVFNLPSFGPPRSLRACLIDRVPHTLNQRLELAKQMAKAVNYVHTLEFVHKNVWPENMLGFGGKDSCLGAFYLIGFQQVRAADGTTCLQGDDVWERNLYRHPTRQTSFPEEFYRMQHDIYSLGVCLLEIGLWESFVAYNDDGSLASPGSVLALYPKEFKRKRPNDVKRHLEILAKAELAQIMGETYTEVVLNCLTCLDEDNMDFGDEEEFQDADGVSIGVRFNEKVLTKLSSISL